MNQRRRSGAAKSRKPSPGLVVNLAQAREQHRHRLVERRVRSVIDDNKGALARLFSSGLIFTMKGSRAGRELLAAHQRLMKAVDQLARDDGADEQLFQRLDAQLQRTAALTARTGEYLARLD